MNKIYTLYVDGGITRELGSYFSYRLVPGDELFGSRIKLSDLMRTSKLPKTCGIFNDQGQQTCNISEYAALYFGLKAFKEMFDDYPVIVYQDSLLIVRQVAGIYRVHQPYLQTWHNEVTKLMNNVTHIWVGREKIVQQLGH